MFFSAFQASTRHTVPLASARSISACSRVAVCKLTCISRTLRLLLAASVALFFAANGAPAEAKPAKKPAAKVDSKRGRAAGKKGKDEDASPAAEEAKGGPDDPRGRGSDDPRGRGSDDPRGRGSEARGSLAAPIPAARPAGAATTADDDASKLQRGERVEFDTRLIQGQTAKAGAVYLFARVSTNLRSMVKERGSFRDKMIRTIYPRDSAGASTEDRRTSP